jgi:hypothetical protein
VNDVPIHVTTVDCDFTHSGHRNSDRLANPIVDVVEQDDDQVVEVERSERRQLKLSRLQRL